MTLTHEHVQDLTAPFTAQETEFFGGFAYISEVGVTSRLDYVDTAWSIEHLKTEYTPVQVAVWLRLTVCGVSRDGVGMAKLTLEKKDGTVITAGEPEKSAATDALRRAARLFGIGRYLLLLPDTVKDEKSLTRWLHDNMGIETTPPRKNEPSPILASNSANSKEPYEFVVTGFAFERSDKKQNYAFYTTEGDTVYAYGHDVLRQWGYNESHWSKWEQTPGKRVGMPDGFTVMAVYQDTGNSGYWLAESGKRVQS